MAYKYGHVGRPTNEEVNNLKKKKILKIVLSLTGIIFVLGGLFLFLNRDNLELSSVMGNFAAQKRVMTLKGNDGKTAYVISCSNGYKLKYKNEKKDIESRGYYCQKNKKSKDANILKIPFYAQNDFKNIASRCGGGKLNEKGCLPTSGAMIFSALLNEEITPIDMNSAAYGYSSSNICYSQSYTVSFLEKYAKSNDITYAEYTKKDISNIIKKLNSGNCIGLAALEKKASCIGNVKNNLCYAPYGHFVVFYANGLSSNKVFVNDPAKKNGQIHAIKEYNLSDIISSSQSDKVRLFCK